VAHYSWLRAPNERTLERVGRARISGSQARHLRQSAVAVRPWRRGAYFLHRARGDAIAPLVTGSSGSPSEPSVELSLHRYDREVVGDVNTERTAVQRTTAARAYDVQRVVAQFQRLQHHVEPIVDGRRVGARGQRERKQAVARQRDLEYFG